MKKYLSVALAVLLFASLALVPTTHAVTGGPADGLPTTSPTVYSQVFGNVGLTHPAVVHQPGDFVITTNIHAYIPFIPDRPFPLANAPTVVIIGLSWLGWDIPFGDWYMEVSNDFIFTGSTDATGNITWPLHVENEFPSDVSIYFQFWQDQIPGPGASWVGASSCVAQIDALPYYPLYP